MISYRDLLMLKLSETTQWNGKEMVIPNSMMEDHVRTTFTCEFVDLENRIYILRGYNKNEKRDWQIEYQNGQEHGQYIVWYKNGAKRWQDEYQNGQPHGQSIGWYRSGIKFWQREYRNGRLIRKIK